MHRTHLAVLISFAACTPQDATVVEDAPPRFVAMTADAGNTVPIIDAGSAPDPISNRGVINPACPEHGAQITAWTFPNALTARWTKNATVTVKNTGSTTWRDADQLMLGSPDNSDPFFVDARVRHARFDRKDL